jgi:hypothetical protein
MTQQHFLAGMSADLVRIKNEKTVDRNRGHLPKNHSTSHFSERNKQKSECTVSAALLLLTMMVTSANLLLSLVQA